MSLALPRLTARRVLRRVRWGSSSPVVVETGQGAWLLKLRGAAQGPAALVAEVIVGALADRLGLPVPPRAVVTLAPGTPSEDRNDELADLLAASQGDNLGFQYRERARALRPSDLAGISTDWASQVRWLDWLVLNPDRSRANPNVLVEGTRHWLIDHGAALFFHHDWSAVTEQMPERLEAPVEHLFAGMATRLLDWDPILTSLLGRDELTAAVETVPDSLLAPLVESSRSPDAIDRRRAAYVAFLWKRLTRKHHFTLTAANLPPPALDASHTA